MLASISKGRSGVRATYRNVLVISMLLLACGCDDDEEDDDSADQQKCEELKDVATECFDGFCSTSSVAFCGCWNNGQDINVSTCECAPLDLDAVCAAINLDDFDRSQYNCSAATTVVSDFCN